jgi:hypothetical protein
MMPTNGLPTWTAHFGSAPISRGSHAAGNLIEWRPAILDDAQLPFPVVATTTEAKHHQQSPAIANNPAQGERKHQFL